MWVLNVTNAPRHEINSVFIHSKPKALDVLPIIVLTCANGLKSIRSVGTGNSIFVVPRVCDLQVQLSIYLSAGEGKEVRRYSLKGEKVFAADLEGISSALEREKGEESLPVSLSASVFLEVDPGDTTCPPVSP